MREVGLEKYPGIVDVLALQSPREVRYDDYLFTGATTNRISADAITIAAVATPPDLRTMRAEVKRADDQVRRRAAHAFADRVRGKRGVEEIWMQEHEGEVIVTVITSDFDLDRDLELQAAFSASARDAGSQACSLDIFTVSEATSDDFRSGLLL